MARHSRLLNHGGHQPTPERRRQVMALTGYGISAVEIATLLEVDRKTLAKHYRRELDIGATEANARVAQALYTNATRHNSVAAQIWWTKARMKWKEHSDLTIDGDQRTHIEFSWADDPLQKAAVSPVIDANAEPAADAQDADAVEVTFAGE